MSSGRPVVLQVIPEMGPGGAEQGCFDVAVGLTKIGATPIILCQAPVAGTSSRIPDLQRAGVQVLHLPVKSKNPFTLYTNIKKIEKIIKDHKVDLLHVRSRAPAWSCLAACRNLNIPFVTTCHAPYKITSALKKKYNSIMSKGERVIAISDYVADYLRDEYAVGADRLRVIPRGVDVQKFHPAIIKPERMIKLAKSWRIPEDALVLLMPGRLTRWKGQIMMIEAMEKLNRQDVICVMVGSDQGRSEYRRELEQMIQTKNLGGHIRLVDHCEDMPAAYMLAHCVLSTSLEPEGFGRIAIEAQAMGRPIIATDHGGSRETILHQETGFLVGLGDNLATDLATTINHVLALPEEEKNALSLKAYEHIHAHFTKDLMVQRTLDVYAECLEDRM
jgi:glycosyltransferase involved in cell wall biosynthesis